MGTAKTAGLIMMAAGGVIFLVAALFVGSGYAGGQVGISGAILGVGLFGILPLLVLGGAGSYVYMRGRAEEVELRAIRKKERLLGLIQAQGKASLGNIMIETKMSREEVRDAIYELVNQGLFAGYIDWTTQTFYSKDAALIGSTTCPNCGGVRELAGKGIVKCPYCGVELFIPSESKQFAAASA